MVEPLDTKAWVIVPVEPAEEMVAAVPASFSASFQAIWPQICGDIYRAMLSASPSLSVVDGGETAEKSEALAREYRPTMDKDIVHAWGADAAAALSEAATLITTQKQEIERLTKEHAASQAVIEVQRQKLDVNAGWEAASAAESRVLSLEEEVKRPRTLGDTLSNITFNLAQPSSPLTNDQKAVMREAVTQWDADRQALSEGEQT